MAPLRLVVLAHPRHPVAQPFAGGMESHTWHLCRELTTMGVHTILSRRRAPTRRSPPSCGRMRRCTLSATAAADLSRPSDVELYQHHAVAQAIAAITGDPTIDVVHNQTLHHLPIVVRPCCRRW